MSPTGVQTGEARAWGYSDEATKGGAVGAAVCHVSRPSHSVSKPFWAATQWAGILACCSHRAECDGLLIQHIVAPAVLALLLPHGSYASGVWDYFNPSGLLTAHGLGLGLPNLSETASPTPHDKAKEAMLKIPCITFHRFWDTVLIPGQTQRVGNTREDLHTCAHHTLWGL